MKKILCGVVAVCSLLPMLALAQVGDVNPNPNSTCVSITHNLGYGSRDSQTGGDVSNLQFMLQSKGYLNSDPTGYFGLLTQAAVKSFQSASGILNSGYVGSITRAKISSICVTSPVTPTPSPITPPICPLGALFNSMTGAPCSGVPTQPISPTPILPQPVSQTSLTITSPVGGENWVIGSTHNITWNAMGVNNVNIALAQYTNGVLTEEPAIATNVSASSGSYSWTIGDFNPTGQTFKIFITDPASLTQTSSGFFNINQTPPYTAPQPTITVTSPAAGTTLQEGNQYTIQWIGSNLPSDAQINIYVINGTSASNHTGVKDILYPELPSTATSYTWTVQGNDSNNWINVFGMAQPKNSILKDLAGVFGVNTAYAQTVNNQYIIQVSAWDPAKGVTTFGYSAPFTIISSGIPIQSPSITVLSPTAGQVLSTGQTVNIQWQANNLDTVNINLTNSFGPPQNIATGVNASLGSYSWTVPNLEYGNGQYQISISGTGSNVVNGPIIGTSGSVSFSYPSRG